MSHKSFFSGLTLSVVALASMASYAGSTDCDAEADLLQAHYSIVHKSGSKELEEHVVLTRHEGLVAHTDEATNITDVWFRHKNKRVALVRYFDEHKRGIEYEPFDLNQQQGAIDWGNKYQLVSNETLKALQLKGSVGERCDVIETYVGKIDGVELTIEWRPALNLLESLTAKKGDKFRHVKQLELDTNVEHIKQFLAVRERFMTTDYTDIGDNESDPFLLKMVNLGFVEHGAEGFYDADGNKMGGGHGHHH